MKNQYSFHNYPNHKKETETYINKWVKNTLSTQAMTEDDKEICRTEIEKLYKNIGLVPPPRNRIVFVSSPFVGAVASGFAAAVWYKRKHNITDSRRLTKYCTLELQICKDMSINTSTRKEISSGQYLDMSEIFHAFTEEDVQSAVSRDITNRTYQLIKSTSYALRAKIEPKTFDIFVNDYLRSTVRNDNTIHQDVINIITENAKIPITIDSTQTKCITNLIQKTVYSLIGMMELSTETPISITQDIVYDAKNAVPFKFNEDIVKLTDNLGIGIFGLECSKLVENIFYGNNLQNYSNCFIDFFKNMTKTDIDYTKWSSLEQLATHSGPRYMHEDFCIIVDRPKILTIDENNCPHNEFGPYCQWRDGSALYAWHDVQIPASWIESKDTLTAQEVLSVTNVEQRAVGVAIIGWPKILKELNAEVIDDSGIPEVGSLLSVKLPDISTPCLFLKATCPRNGEIMEGVPHIDDFGVPIETAIHAQAWRVGLHESEYRVPEVRT